MKQHHVEDLPYIPINPRNDIPVLDRAVKHYLTSLCGRVLSQEQRAEILVLQNLRRWLAVVPSDTKGIYVPLTVEEIKALDTAIAGFMALAYLSNQPSKGREAQLQRFAAFRQGLQRML